MRYLKHSLQGLAILVIFLGLIPEAQGQKVPNKVLKGFTAVQFQAHINYLASDILLGRNTPSAGLDTAAAYIAAEFKKYGLEPVNGSYYQPLPLVITNLGEDNRVVVEKDGQQQALTISTQYVPFEMTANAEASGELVFAGYGITSPENNYDDYADMDPTGKIVLIISHGPRENDSASPFFNRGRNRLNSLDLKVQNAIAHGAAGILFVTDPLNHLLIKPRGYPWPTLQKNVSGDMSRPRLKGPETKKIPVVHVGKEVIEMAFGSVDSLKNIQSMMDEKMKPASQALAGMKVTIKTSIDEKLVPAQNVAGFLRGSDPQLSQEVLIIGGHYDHVGFRREHKEGDDYIMNGADDNASGTTGVLMTAEAFSRMKNKPARSVLFITFAGEEKGLYGSRAYTEAPLFPLDKTVGMLNLDMISRNNADSLFLEGAVMSPDLTNMVLKANEQVGMKLHLGQETYMDGSDHAPFFNKKVPFVFFFAGLHPDYHTIRDNPNTINAEKGARVSKLVFLTAWMVSNENKHYTVLEKK
ncbi:MAG: M20/M25/M40 family metallo-hydrolase [Bacteroidales bacterium]